MSRTLLLSLVAGLLALALSPWWFASAEAADEPAGLAGTSLTIGRGSLEVRLLAVGELQPSHSTTIASSLSGDRGKIVYLVEDGAVVKQGDVLVRLDRTPFEEARADALLEVDLAKSRVTARKHAVDWQASQSQASIKTAGYEVELAALEKHRFEFGEGPLELARLEAEQSEAEAKWKDQDVLVKELSALLDDGHIQLAEVEQLRVRANEAKRASDLARRQAETYENYIQPSRMATLRLGVERADFNEQEVQVSSAAKLAEVRSAVTLAERDLAAAEARLEEASRNLERTVLRAPADGMLVLTEDFRESERRKPRVGDTVWQGQQIAYLPDLTSMEVHAKIREVDVHKVAPGYLATARVDAYPNLILPATVRAIGVLAERTQSGSGEKTFRLIVDLDQPDERLRPGMTARVEIQSGSVDDAILLPLQALWENDGQSWCWVVRHGEELERREVRIGLRSHQLAEVIDGLAAGERVSLVGPQDK